MPTKHIHFTSSDSAIQVHVYTYGKIYDKYYLISTA